MLPDPLHPAVVHLPIGLAVLMPLLAAAATLAIANRLLPAPTWLVVVLLQVLLAGSAWLAAAVRAGHLGGELVYRHGAATAYTGSNAATGESEP